MRGSFGCDRLIYAAVRGWLFGRTVWDREELEAIPSSLTMRDPP